jgi:hypothetical protein
MSIKINDPILVTGAAGFIGFHLARVLLEQGLQVIGIDNLNDYYDPALKMSRLEILERLPGFRFIKVDLKDRPEMEKVFGEHRFEIVVHLVAQAGVRYSLINLYAYIDSNISGFLNVLEGCRAVSAKHLLFASSSSVYGANRKMPFSVHDNVDHPVSLNAAKWNSCRYNRGTWEEPMPMCRNFRVTSDSGQRHIGRKALCSLSRGTDLVTTCHVRRELRLVKWFSYMVCIDLKVTGGLK